MHTSNSVRYAARAEKARAENRRSSAEAGDKSSAQGPASRLSDPKPTTKRVLYVDPTVRLRPRSEPEQVRAPGRPRKTATPPASPQPQTKRKLAEADDSYDEARKRKRTKAAGAKKADPPHPKPQPKPTKQPTFREGTKAAGAENVKRGTTRSGRPFKG
jgi:hypothetical protein